MDLASSASIEATVEEVLRAQLETNLLGAHELTTRVLPAMRAQGHRRIVMLLEETL